MKVNYHEDLVDQVDHIIPIGSIVDHDIDVILVQKMIVHELVATQVIGYPLVQLN